MIRICNIIAELCSKIIRACPDDSLFVKYSCLSLKRRNEMLRDISENVSLLFAVTSENEDKTLHIRQLKESDLNDVFYAELEEYISKQNPFRTEYDGSAALEGIRINRVVNILHYEGIGRIAILICKDFLTTNYMEQLMRCFKLTLIIVPSFSTGSYDFRQSFDVCAHDDCNIIWINTCAAMAKGKEANFKSIGYVRKRIGRNDDDSQKLCEMPACEAAFRGKCNRDCIYFETIRGV